MSAPLLMEVLPLMWTP